MRLMKLQIERHTYGPQKGAFAGEATFHGDNGKITPRHRDVSLLLRVYYRESAEAISARL